MGHVRDLWTTTAAGKRVRTSRWGSGRRWQATYHDRGRRLTRTFPTRTAAEAFLAETETDRARGQWVAPSKLTVTDYGQRWLADQIHLRASSREQMMSRWTRHIQPALGRLEVSGVTRTDMQSAVTAWSRVLAPTSVAVTYGYAASIFKSAVADRIVAVSPCVRIRLPAIVKARIVPLTAVQVHRIADQVQPRYRALVILAATTGLRQGELRGLTVDRLRFDPDGLTVIVDRQLTSVAPAWGPPKTVRSVRDVPVDRGTADLIRDHLARYAPHPSGLVFTGRTRIPLGRGTMGTIWREAITGMGLRPRSGWHELRHFHASALIAAGLSVVAVADRLGHQDPKETLNTYAHLWPSDDSRAREASGMSVLTPTPGLRAVN